MNLLKTLLPALVTASAVQAGSGVQSLYIPSQCAAKAAARLAVFAKYKLRRGMVVRAEEVMFREKTKTTGVVGARVLFVSKTR
jgi:hypothetical protein